MMRPTAVIMPVASGRRGSHAFHVGTCRRSSSLAEQGQDASARFRDRQDRFERKRLLEGSCEGLRLRGPREEGSAADQKLPPSYQSGDVAQRARRRDFVLPAGKFLDSLLDDIGIPHWYSLDHVPQESGAEAPRLQEGYRETWASDSEGDTGQPGTRTDVENSSAMRN